MPIEIPDLLAARLGQDATIDAAVKTTLHRFDPWLSSSGMPFFPDFTDHGPEHLNRVLRLAEVVIRRDENGDFPEAFTAADAGTLVLAVLLHDLGMHLTEDGFLRLLDQDDPWPKIDALDERSWPELWEEFYAEATRWDDRTLVEHFGDEIERRTTDRPLIRRPEELPTSAWDELDRRLIGEFVRRHHPRIAHEIARFGVPGPESERLQIQVPDGFPEIADLAGFVARSHGTGLRDTFEYLKGQFGSHREFRGTHPLFNMVVLRLADYLDMYAERAPQSLQLVKRQKSPRSKKEWEAHQAIRDIAIDTDDDPELLRITARPENVHIYLRVRDWQDGLQVELDQAWAVLGEVYGRFEEMRSLGLTIRRVRGSLDDPGFQNTVSYVPDRITFGVARSEILGLMIRPLYGERPEIGIRELIQNSVDAVRELQELERRNPQLKQLDLREQEADIVVSVGKDDEGQAWVEVADRGLGMTVEVVRDYFLKAGASYRHSHEWRSRFESTTSTETSPQVLRTGRFGIGAFAIFLLSNEIDVETRHYSEPASRGLRFRARLGEGPVEIEYGKLHVGTRVRVAISEETFESLSWRSTSWHWYRLDFPHVEYKTTTKEDPSISSEHSLRLDDLRGSRSWHQLSGPEGVEVFWSYRYPEDIVLYNGFVMGTTEGAVLDSRRRSELPGEELVINFKWPAIAVLDPTARLPINLTRERFSGDPGFQAELQEEIAKSFLAFLLVNGPRFRPVDPPSLLRSLGFTDMGHFQRKSFEDDVESSLVMLRDGFVVPSSEALYANGIDHLIVIGEDLLYLRPEESVIASARVEIGENQGWFRVKKYYADETNPVGWIEQVYGENLHWHRRKIRGARFLGKGPITAEDIDLGLKLYQGVEAFFGDLELHKLEDEWYSLEAGEVGSSAFRKEFLIYVDEVVETKKAAGFTLPSLPPFLAEFYLSEDPEERLPLAGSEGSWLWRVWMEVLGQPFIPYDETVRREVLASAYSSLEEYVLEHEAEKGKSD